MTAIIYYNIIYNTGAERSFEYISYNDTFPIFLSEPGCSGSEEHLINCQLSEIENITSCSYASVVHCAGI